MGKVKSQGHYSLGTRSMKIVIGRYLCKMGSFESLSIRSLIRMEGHILRRPSGHAYSCLDMFFR